MFGVTTFNLKLVTLSGTLDDQTYRIESSNTLKTIQYNEATSGEASHTFTDSAVRFDGSGNLIATPAWYTLDGSLNDIYIQESDASVAGVYNLAVKAVVDQRTSAWHYITFKATLFTYTAQTNLD